MFSNLLGVALSVPIAIVGHFLVGSRTTVCQCNFEAASETSLEVVCTLKSQLDRCGPEHLGAVCDSITLERALAFTGLTAAISFGAGWHLGRSVTSVNTRGFDEQPPRWHPPTGSEARALSWGGVGAHECCFLRHLTGTRWIIITPHFDMYGEDNIASYGP